MYKHLLIATDGSELSKLALQEGVALAKALGAHVTAITVTPPFHIFTSDPAMVADTADEYGRAWRLKPTDTSTSQSTLRQRRVWHAISCIWSTSIPIKPSSTLPRIEAAM